MHIGLSEDDFLESLKALKSIGTPEAMDLFRRAVVFWKPVLNKGQKKQMDKILAG